MAIVTLSRGTLFFGQALAEKVAAALGCPCVGRELVRDAAEQLGISHELMARKLEELPTFWERLTSERKVYMTAMQAALADHVLKGDFVYHSWAGHLLLKGVPAMLKVRAVAPQAKRVASWMEREKLTREAAEAHVRQVDEERARWTRFIYGVDWRDPALYDLVLNLDAMTLESACEAVVVLAGRPEFAIPAGARGKLADFALASRVRLLLARSSESRALDLDVEASDGVVTLRGCAPALLMPGPLEERFKADLGQRVLTVEGVKDVRLFIHASGRPSVY
jgi:cytidylate kinase